MQIDFLHKELNHIIVALSSLLSYLLWSWLSSRQRGRQWPSQRRKLVLCSDSSLHYPPIYLFPWHFHPIYLPLMLYWMPTWEVPGRTWDIIDLPCSIFSQKVSSHIKWDRVLFVLCFYPTSVFEKNIIFTNHVHPPSEHKIRSHPVVILSFIPSDMGPH